MIIAEGPDGAGKTTLVHDISRSFGLEVGQRAVADRKKLYTVTRQDTYTALGTEVTGHALPQVWDRLYYSELVYADIVGRPVEFKPRERDFIQNLIELLRCPVIWCLPPIEVVMANAAKDEQMDGVNENIQKIYQRYLSIPMPRQTMVYDYTNPEGTGGHSINYMRHSVSYSTIMAVIRDHIRRRRDREW